MPRQNDPQVVFEWDDDRPVPEDGYPIWTGSDLPMWFKMLSSLTDDGERTVKLCSSFCDAMRMGYILPVTYDIHYDRTGDELVVETDDDVDVDVTVYGHGENERKGDGVNSTFKQPEATIPNPWKIHTPEGAVTLVTYLMNRPSNNFRAYTMLVDTAEYDGRIPIPISFTDGDEGTIEAGSYLAQVIPLWEDGVDPDWSIVDEEDDPRLQQVYSENGLQTRAVSGFYRRFCWQPKTPQRMAGELPRDELPDGNAKAVLESVDRASAEPDGDTPGFDQEKPPRFYIHSKDRMDSEKPLLPPKPATEFGIPQWVEDPDTLNGAGEQEEKLAEWARNSYDLGYILPITEPYEFTVDGDNFTYDIATQDFYDQSDLDPNGRVGVHPDGRFGTDLNRFPIPFQIIRASTSWSIFTPPGYSVLIREPLNHRQEKYRSWAGLADADYYCVDGNSIGNFEPIDQDGDYYIDKGEANFSALAIHRDAILSPAAIVE